MRKNDYLTDHLLDNAPCGYLQIDSAGIILMINRTLRKWLDYEIEDAIENRSIEQFFKTGGKIYFQTHMMPLLQMQKEISEINLTMEGKNGTTFPVLINAKEDAHQPGKAKTFSVFILNITQ